MRACSLDGKKPGVWFKSRPSLRDAPAQAAKEPDQRLRHGFRMGIGITLPSQAGRFSYAFCQSQNIFNQALVGAQSTAARIHPIKTRSSGRLIGPGNYFHDRPAWLPPAVGDCLSDVQVELLDD
jgi:hypothetical protein